MSANALMTERIVCHCLQVSAAEIHAALACGHAASLHEVIRLTGAGRGCTACHCAIKELLDGQCPSSSSPTCVVR